MPKTDDHLQHLDDIAGPPLLTVDALTVREKIRQDIFTSHNMVTTLNAVSFVLNRGQTLAVVGESGCGKTTLAKHITGIHPSQTGTIRLDGKPIESFDKLTRLKRIRQVFQNPYASLNPSRTIYNTLAAPLVIHGYHNKDLRREMVANMLDRVGLNEDAMEKYPGGFSSGERQRIAIARALILNPDVIVADEPISTLDISVQAQVLNLLIDIQKSLNIAYLFISHDLVVVRNISDQVLVIYLGHVFEYGPTEDVFKNPKHPYTQMLICNTPEIATRAIIPHAERLKHPQFAPRPSTGCAFHNRCPFATDMCYKTPPEPKRVGAQMVACHHTDKINTTT